MSQEQKLIQPETSLVKYRNPQRIAKKTEDEKASDGFDPRAACRMQSTESILSSIMPPRRIKIKDEIFIQEVSSSPASRIEVVQLTRLLDQQLEARGAKMTGICPVRRELFSQVFDELIRQLTIHCAERGLLLLRVRNEVATTIAALQSIYASGVVFGLQKSLAREADRNRQENRVVELETEIAQLKKRVKETGVEENLPARVTTERYQAKNLVFVVDNKALLQVTSSFIKSQFLKRILAWLFVLFLESYQPCLGARRQENTRPHD
ncbi:unnamed protein product [Schistocephalus solidus]|uniref:Dynein light chain n=1 Tax=Schistocephalus solidus TaxID=70667 RepID=A0A183S7D3_SCHSO|nr:unnamed protein product [Schistocephalus solidus]